jgi:hypothetical protein
MNSQVRQVFFIALDSILIMDYFKRCFGRYNHGNQPIRYS